MAHPVASLTLVAPVTAHGHGGVRPDGTPCAPDGAGSGGGTSMLEVGTLGAAGVVPGWPGVDVVLTEFLIPV